MGLSSFKFKRERMTFYICKGSQDAAGTSQKVLSNRTHSISACLVSPLTMRSSARHRSRNRELKRREGVTLGKPWEAKV